MRLAFLLGSGASRPAGMPSVDDITRQVGSGENVVRDGSAFYLVEKLPPPEALGSPLKPVLSFVEQLRRICNTYFDSQEKPRVANYEDISYVARQIDDGLRSEYE